MWLSTRDDDSLFSLSRSACHCREFATRVSFFSPFPQSLLIFSAVVIASNCKSRPLLTEAFSSKLLENNTTGEWFNIHIPQTVAPKLWDVRTPFKGDSMAALKKIKKNPESLSLVRSEYHCVLHRMQRCFMGRAAALCC